MSEKGTTLPFPPSFPLPFLPLSPSPPSTLLPLGEGPSNPARWFGERCKLPSTSGRNPSAKRYVLHFGLKKASDDSNFTCIFTKKNEKFDKLTAERSYNRRWAIYRRWGGEIKSFYWWRKCSSLPQVRRCEIWEPLCWEPGAASAGDGLTDFMMMRMMIVRMHCLKMNCEQNIKNGRSRTLKSS